MRRADFQPMRLQTIIEGSTRASVGSAPGGSTSLTRTGKPRLRNDALDQSDSADQAETLLDLFWTVYSKLRAVVEGHRVVSEIVGRIGMVSVAACGVVAPTAGLTALTASRTGATCDCDTDGGGHQADAKRGEDTSGGHGLF